MVGSHLGWDVPALSEAGSSTPGCWSAQQQHKEPGVFFLIPLVAEERRVRLLRHRVFYKLPPSRHCIKLFIPSGPGTSMRESGTAPGPAAQAASAPPSTLCRTGKDASLHFADFVSESIGVRPHILETSRGISGCTWNMYQVLVSQRHAPNEESIFHNFEKLYNTYLPT